MNYLSASCVADAARCLSEAKDESAGGRYSGSVRARRPELIEGLCAIGPRAHVILANGADEEGDESKEAAQTLGEQK